MADSEEFSNVSWDMQPPVDKTHADFLEDKHVQLGNHHLTVMDPLSDMNNTFQDILTLADNEDQPMHNSLSWQANGTSSPESDQVDVYANDPLSSQASFDPHVDIHNGQPSASVSPQKMAAQGSRPEASASASKLSMQWKAIRVTDPQKESHGQTNYITYSVTSDKSTVRRRFQDFVWLYNVLYMSYPACFIPPLPDKHRMEYVKGDRFGTDFVEQRRASLERFLQRIARHPILAKAEFFIMFLSSPQFNDASARAMREGQETMIDTIGDSLLNAFAKIRKKDAHFVEMKERVGRLSDNLSVLEKTQLRAHKRTEELHHDYQDFVTAIRGLSELEPNMKELQGFGDAISQYAQYMKEMSEHDGAWFGEVHDYMTYCSSVKGVLKLREQKQLDFEELSEYLQSTIKEREKTLHPHHSDSTYSITGFFTDKFNEVRGADTDKIRREKVLRLDERIRELQEAVEQAHQVSTAFSEQVKREDDILARSKAAELSESLKSYTDAKVNFYQKGAALWENVVKSLENIETDD